MSVFPSTARPTCLRTWSLGDVAGTARNVKLKTSIKWNFSLARMSIKLLRAFVSVCTWFRLHCVITALTLCSAYGSAWICSLGWTGGGAGACRGPVHLTEGVVSQHGFVWLNKVVLEQKASPLGCAAVPQLRSSAKSGGAGFCSA